MPVQATGADNGNGFSSKRIGPLQRQLRNGEYGFFKYSPMFESDFVQISKHGGPVEITNDEQIVTLGISFTSPVLLIPDVLLVARPIYQSEILTLTRDIKFSPRRTVKYELSRLFPLCLVKISIHDADKQQLKFKLASGRTFYLQLCPESYRRDFLFDSWIRIIQLLRPPSNIKSALEEEAAETSRIRSSPPPRPKAPSPKRPIKSTTAWSQLTFIKGLAEDKEKRKISTAKFPMSLAKAQDPASSPREAREAELVHPPSSQAWEEVLAERNPSHRSEAGERARHERSPPNKRRSNKESHSSRRRSEERGGTNEDQDETAQGDHDLSRIRAELRTDMTEIMDARDEVHSTAGLDVG